MNGAKRFVARVKLRVSYGTVDQLVYVTATDRVSAKQILESEHGRGSIVVEPHVDPEWERNEQRSRERTKREHWEQQEQKRRDAEKAEKARDKEAREARDRRAREHCEHELQVTAARRSAASGERVASTRTFVPAESVEAMAETERRDDEDGTDSPAEKPESQEAAMASPEARAAKPEDAHLGLAGVMFLVLLGVGLSYVVGLFLPKISAYLSILVGMASVIIAAQSPEMGRLKQVVAVLFSITICLSIFLSSSHKADLKEEADREVANRGIGRSYSQVLSRLDDGVEMEPDVHPLRDGRESFDGKFAIGIGTVELIGPKRNLQEASALGFLTGDPELGAKTLLVMTRLTLNAVPEWEDGHGEFKRLMDIATAKGNATATEGEKEIRIGMTKLKDGAMISVSVKRQGIVVVGKESADSHLGVRGPIVAQPSAELAQPVAPPSPPPASYAQPATSGVVVISPANAAPSAAPPPPAPPSVPPIQAADDEATTDTATSAEELNRQGGVLLAQGQQEESISYFDRAFALDSKLTGALLNKGYALQRLGRLVEAQAAGDKVLELSAVARIRASAQVLLGKVAEESGQVAQARARYQQALREKSNYPQALEALAALPGVDETRENGQPPPSPPTSKRPSGSDHKPNPFVDPSQEKPAVKAKRWADPFAPE